jgi:hypothetical protein
MFRLGHTRSTGRLLGINDTYLPSEFLGGALTVDVTIAGQQFTQVLDSGSSTVFTYGADCSACGTDRLLNTTGLPLVATGVSGVYGSGGFTGDAFRAPVSVSDAEAVDVVIVVAHAPALTGELPADIQGILGIGRLDEVFAPTTSWPALFLNANHLTHAITVDACAGVLTMGVATSDVAIPTDSDLPYYNVPNVVIGRGAHSTPSNQITILDTGTSLNVLPMSMYAALVNNFQQTYAAQLATAFETPDYLWCAAGSSGCGARPLITSAEINAMFPVAEFVFGDVSVQAPAVNGWFLDIDGYFVFAFKGGSITIPWRGTAYNPVVLGYPFHLATIVTHVLGNDMLPTAAGFSSNVCGGTTHQSTTPNNSAPTPAVIPSLSPTAAPTMPQGGGGEPLVSVPTPMATPEPAPMATPVVAPAPEPAPMATPVVAPAPEPAPKLPMLPLTPITIIAPPQPPAPNQPMLALHPPLPLGLELHTETSGLPLNTPIAATAISFGCFLLLVLAILAAWSRFGRRRR